MKTNLRWEQEIFSSTYSIYSNNQLIGKLKDRTFSQSADGELNGKAYIFRTKGLFKQHTEILDKSEDKVIGEITFNTWMTKASLSFNEKRANWKYDNPWSTKWRIFDSEGIEIKYSGRSGKGQIESNSDDPLLLLSGLFVTNYYWQLTVVVLVAVFVPIWVTVLS
jgi:hypothetical protein